MIKHGQFIPEHVVETNMSFSSNSSMQRLYDYPILISHKYIQLICYSLWYVNPFCLLKSAFTPFSVLSHVLYLTGSGGDGQGI